MTVELYDIFLEYAQLDESEYKRPIIVAGKESEQKFRVFLISSSMDLYDEHRDFLIKPSYDGFEQTGLDRESYEYGGSAHIRSDDNLNNKIGKFEKEIKYLFEEFWLDNVYFQQ